MSDTVVVPKKPVHADVVLFGGDRIAGDFFLSPVLRKHGGPETLLSLLNDNTRSFVPFQGPHNIILLNRVAIRSVEFNSPEVTNIFTRPDNDHIYAMRITLRVETKNIRIEGFCFTGGLAKEHRRPIDLLNSNDMFLLVYSQGRLVLLNKTAISHADI